MAMTTPKEKICWWRPPDMPGVEVLDVEHCAQLWTTFHQTYTICTLTKLGLSEWVYRSKRNTLYNHHLMMMEPGEVHRTTRISGPASFGVVLLDHTSVETLAQEAGYRSKPHFKAFQSRDPELVRAFTGFHYAMVDTGTSLLERQSRLTGCLIQLLAKHGEESFRAPHQLKQNSLHRARDYLHEHLTENPSLDELAILSGLSRFHFLRSFAAQFGLPPHSYQTNLRVQKTRELLRAGVPIAEVNTGFADQSHLTRHFKRLVGVTPGQYVSMNPRRSFG